MIELVHSSNFYRKSEITINLLSRLLIPVGILYDMDIFSFYHSNQAILFNLFSVETTLLNWNYFRTTLVIH